MKVRLLAPFAPNLAKLVFCTAIAGGVMMSGQVYAAAGDDTIRIGFISPRTGPLASFGKTDGFVLKQARQALANGMTVEGKHYQVEIIDRDSQSDPARASQLAKELINQDVDLMLAISTPEVINPVADASEAAGIPFMSTVMPWEAWYYGRGAKPGEESPFEWTYHFGFGAGEFYKTYISQWSLIDTNKKVGVMYPNDADGNAIRAVLAPRLAKAGYTVIDPGAYETGTSDFSSQIALFKREGVEIINSFPIPPDFAAFWRQSAQQGLHRQIKIIQIAKTGLFPSDIEVLGSLGPKIASAAYWHKTFPYTSPLTGLNGEQLADMWETETGEQWTQQLGATLSLLDAGTEALKQANDPLSRTAVRDAISQLNVTTIGGQVDFTSGPVPNVASGPIVGAQWVKGTGQFKLDYVITENVTDPNVPVTHNLLQYNTK
ncbi:ABC transporter substrate-binding protein [Marinomonas rhizomae]|uniref:Amino acid/amide ABC transporter substrate-binding protein (HAAT family) n=1 Tax=Marinomonas rhizomae TaxID=491948 RepID=A0A366IYS1_9GAMM|nr:ABC transporter substrate-binding protein [Marinomonas rhizomae]RBP79154.1 amino acid/amide ABC transporter substrate-binding protein (HAAT family) [Marinomonas rhizomae]RNF70446.1 ABC transporter substrate-binding protein [Marinomonas rhizomae]